MKIYLNACGKGDMINMNSKQYNNIIDWTIKHEVSVNSGDSLEIAKAIFKNMGIPLPNGNLKNISNILKTGNYMGWKSCNMKEAQENADNGIATIGINNDRIVILSATDEESEATLDIAAVLSLSEKTPAYTVYDLQFYSYNDTTTCCPYYTSFLISDCGFSSSTTSLILSLYSKIDKIYSNESKLERAWRCARLLGGIVYYGYTKILFVKIYKWDNVAGQVFIDDTDENEKEKYFTSTLGFTSSQYEQLKKDIVSQHSNTKTPDFAHMQISLSARLAYLLDRDGLLSNIGGHSDEDVSYLAGWLGDATILNEYATTTMGDDDYCADLDAENIYRFITNGDTSTVTAANLYYKDLHYYTRAEIFLTYISYITVRMKIFDQFHYSIYGNMEEVKKRYPDTYNFLYSLQHELAHMGNFIMPY
jgi:hypothetical protein